MWWGKQSYIQWIPQLLLCLPKKYSAVSLVCTPWTTLERGRPRPWSQMAGSELRCALNTCVILGRVCYGVQLLMYAGIPV